MFGHIRHSRECGNPENKAKTLDSPLSWRMTIAAVENDESGRTFDHVH